MYEKEKVAVFLNDKVKQLIYCRKKDLVSLLLAEYKIDIGSEDVANDRIQDWIDSEPPNIGTKTGQEFMADFNVLAMPNGQKIKAIERIYYLKTNFEQNQVLYAKKLIVKGKFDLAQNVLSSRNISTSEFVELFQILNKGYPSSFTIWVLDSILKYLKNPENTQYIKFMDKSKKIELLEIIDSMFKEYPLHIYSMDSPDLAEYRRLDKEISELMGGKGGTMYHSDISKNTPTQNKIKKLDEEKGGLYLKIDAFDKELEQKKTIRYKLVEIIVLLENDKNKLPDYLVADLEQFKIDFKKAMSLDSDINKLCESKNIKRAISVAFLSDDTEINKLESKLSTLNYKLNKLATVIIYCYSKSIVSTSIETSAVGKSGKGELITKYLDYSGIQYIINSIFR